MYIPQKQLKRLKKTLKANKVMVIYGPRRCGKTTLLEHFLKDEKKKYLFVSGEDIINQEYLGSQSIEKLKGFIGNNKLLVIDEAQKIKDIGLNLKLIVDHLKDLFIVATGSSSFDLARNVGEPLTGRKITLQMFPLAQLEIMATETLGQTKANLENRLIYGSYPEVVIIKDNTERARYLKEIVSSYLYKDILELEGIKHADKIVRLLQLLAFQIGQEASHSELGTQLGISKNTVERYLDLLEKAFVIYRLSGFSRNLRKEISKNHRYFFYDVGIRNALINNFNPLKIRDDVGMLWENYLVSERLKKQAYLGVSANNYFWRTYDKKEIDLVEEREGKLFGYEIKWSAKKPKVIKDWVDTYPNARYQVINRENYLDFIT
ncbi:AAA family ATPase [candidate division WOR-1 bacterium RIFOXYB2_FULL_42_35]|uniref:AAA family ATPase n=1 Tax=candidate division WOR-1 bacterium RIFOXYC2_FULL_41_25 TaxID=1802586 RepID=A0A1F4TLR7_UNCSA|nr:MAG: AAA family ATPase [candidate division WOR-1 bacterium RIFOXYB2_FULL_42_35]OGC23062.1 MAG: AAA family ATPase [candidate division WOR-1 bacterium RIFOXYA2_FULL_41_14]OGC33634.1 MAG: AAA family ATPase [candidate division WOR-1 bacterium RIFOXYC2_FULL_41_25]OGC43598.1 MAG: AAA family ATPase [candidate division WOR-1 bacterium RIFOXYD2_FULL_41_8]